ncbi:hypothetical protein PIB30_066268 [Stylosanthes scabra]|uniref:Uncharacterized protein n=1 Tax=Stylosanthes scabra TaxID=79078 RepID=A0ABU6TPM9_9FABA|nr:hypothetical protein [Stylosanthes scabra]
MALKRTNKANRASSADGSLHTGGSITYPATAEKMLEELGCTPTQSEVFTRTHTKKKDRGQWVDWRAEEANQQYEEELKRLEEERAALIAVGCPEVAGSRKRGRVYGRDKVPSRLKPTAYDSDDLSTASGPVDMREEVTLLNRELTQQAEEHRQEVQALSDRHAAQIKSNVSQMYSFMQNMQAGSASSSAEMPPPMPPPSPPFQHGPSGATDQPPSDADRSPHDDPDYI